MCVASSNRCPDPRLALCDGLSIGSNDLPQLTLGVDRVSGLLMGFDERNEVVTVLIEMAIRACKAAGKYIGICGQAPSDFPEITRWLVDQGIDSITLNPDSILKMTGGHGASAGRKWLRTVHFVAWMQARSAIIQGCLFNIFPGFRSSGPASGLPSV